MVALLKDKIEDKVVNNNDINNIKNGISKAQNDEITKFDDEDFLEKCNDEELDKEGILGDGKVVQDFKWRNIIFLSFLHLFAMYTILTFPFFNLTHIYTIIFTFFWAQLGIFGTTAGAHRLWSHRSYKARLPLQILLMICYMTAGIVNYTANFYFKLFCWFVNPLFEWIRDHRIHHRYTETDADPHNSKRGFFFAHVGWLMMKKHPEVIRRGKQVDMTDVYNNPVIMFEEKFYIPLWLFFNLILPPCIPVYFWNENWYYAIVMTVVVRWSLFLNGLWSVNSAAHIWGSRPYDKKIAPTENFWVSLFGMGEGWHNYHHSFPWDYKAAELPYYFNVAGTLIRFFYTIGWAYDLKEPSENLIKMVTLKKGDGSHHHVQEVPPPLDEDTKNL